MATNNDLFEGVGKSVKVDHVAVQTAFGMMIAAKRIFEKLGFAVHPTRKAEGDWGKAVFMVREGSVSIQVTDSSNETKIVAGENHVGIMVDEPNEVSLAMYAWARRGGLSAEIEEVPGGKYFVSIPEILTMPIELVPSPRIVCPECNGEGEVVIGSEGRGFHYPCNTCKGKKSIPLTFPPSFFELS